MVDSTSRPRVWVYAFDDVDPVFGLPLQTRSIIGQHFNIVTSDQIESQPEVAPSVTGALVFGRGSAIFKSQRPLLVNLRIVGNVGAGVDHLDVGHLRELGIEVSNTPEVLSNAVADMTFALLLASARNLHSGAQLAMNREKMPVFGTNTFGVEVTGSTLGIIGMGSIGVKVAKRAKAFDMEVCYHNRSRRSAEVETSIGATYCLNIEELLRRCDFVVLACPLTPQTRHLIGAEQLACMKKSATIINISRGEVVDQDALVKSLRSGQIRAAALDVTSPEPLPRDHPLLQLDNVIITPHTGSATLHTRSKMVEPAVTNLKAGLIDNTPLPNLVN